MSSTSTEPPAFAGGSRVPGDGPSAEVVPVVGLAHGSRHDRGRVAIEALMAEVEVRTGVPARPAYLDLAAPDLDAVCAELAEQGHRRAIVVPLLFTAAFHATVDVPQAVAAAAEAHGLEITVAAILGTGDDVAAVLTQALVDRGVDPADDALLFAVGSSRPEANEAVADLAARLSRGRTGRVRAAFGTCAPRPDELLAGLGDPVALWPLFLADGLLLDPLRAMATERGWPLVEPLGALATDLVVARYAAALRGQGTGTPAGLG